jgi:hypothetical protein
VTADPTWTPRLLLKVIMGLSIVGMAWSLMNPERRETWTPCFFSALICLATLTILAQMRGGGPRPG